MRGNHSLRSVSRSSPPSFAVTRAAASISAGSRRGMLSEKLLARSLSEHRVSGVHRRGGTARCFSENTPRLSHGDAYQRARQIAFRPHARPHRLPRAVPIRDAGSRAHCEGRGARLWARRRSRSRASTQSATHNDCERARREAPSTRTAPTDRAPRSKT